MKQNNANIALCFVTISVFQSENKNAETKRLFVIKTLKKKLTLPSEHS
jgi:hypothetical protein